jgi:hypothetical protein
MAPGPLRCRFVTPEVISRGMPYGSTSTYLQNPEESGYKDEKSAAGKDAFFHDARGSTFSHLKERYLVANTKFGQGISNGIVVRSSSGTARI